MSDDDAQAQQQAQQLRQEGNALYKERKFEQAREACLVIVSLFKIDGCGEYGGQSL
jgi:hypothetical protein